jgi:hypothetical protein
MNCNSSAFQDCDVRDSEFATTRQLDGAGTPSEPVGMSIPHGAILIRTPKVSKGVKGKKMTKAGKNGLKGFNRMVTSMTECPRFPPSFNAIPTYQVRRRFVSAENVAVTNLTWTLARGHSVFLIATDTSTLVPYVDMWRISRVSVWTINYVDNATTATLYPVGTDIDSNSFNDRERAFTCSSRSEAQPGYMSIVPARDTPMGSWHKTSTVNNAGSLFVFNVDYGGASSGNWATVTMDIEFDFVPNWFGGPQGFTASVAATAVTGTLYSRSWPATTSAMLVQNVNTI